MWPSSGLNLAILALQGEVFIPWPNTQPEGPVLHIYDYIPRRQGDPAIPAGNGQHWTSTEPLPILRINITRPSRNRFPNKSYQLHKWLLRDFVQVFLYFLSFILVEEMPCCSMRSGFILRLVQV